MSDAYNFIFSSDPRTGALTAEQLQARRQIAIALATRNRPYPKTIGEGLTALGEGLGEGYANYNLSKAEAAQTAGDAAALRPPSGAVPPPAPSVAPAVPRAPAGRTSLEGDTAERSYAMAPPDATETKQPLTMAQASQQPQMPIEEMLQRIKRNDSGSEKDPYRKIGQVNRRGDYPYGAYAVMGEDIPPWTKKHLGREMTPQEFLADDKAQDQIARGQGSEYLAKYGPNGAAAAWAVGEKDMNDTSRPALQAYANEYVKRFNIPLVSRDQVVASAAGGERPIQVASLGGMPMPDTPPDPRDAVAQSIAGPPPQQVAQAQTLPQPTAPQMPISPQRVGPQVPSYPAYGDEPKPPQPTEDMIHYRRVAADPYRSLQTRATAKDLYDQMKASQDQEFARKYDLWKSNKLEETKYKVNLPKMQEDLTNAYLDSLKKPQGIITGQQGPAPQAQPHPDLGTDRSPQRTRIPTPPPKPPDVSLEKWSELQAPEMAKNLAAVDKATPKFNDAIKSIQQAREHPGREWGVGLTGAAMQKLPFTEASGFGKLMEQIQGKLFLAGYEQLRGGGGNISNIEGTKTEQAQAAVSTAQTMKDWDRAMNDLEISMRRDLELAQRRVNAPVTAWRDKGDNSSYAPDIGERRGNNEYVGGNPADPMSWKKIR